MPVSGNFVFGSADANPRSAGLEVKWTLHSNGPWAKGFGLLVVRVLVYGFKIRGLGLREQDELTWVPCTVDTNRAISTVRVQSFQVICVVNTTTL